jgi:hypothetical protein
MRIELLYRTPENKPFSATHELTLSLSIEEALNLTTELIKAVNFQVQSNSLHPDSASKRIHATIRPGILTHSFYGNNPSEVEEQEATRAVLLSLYYAFTQARAKQHRVNLTAHSINAETEASIFQSVLFTTLAPLLASQKKEPEQ